MIRPSDDPYMRIQAQAETRARRNGYAEADVHKAGRTAMVLRRAYLDVKLEPDAELILRTVAGHYRHA